MKKQPATENISTNSWEIKTFFGQLRILNQGKLVVHRNEGDNLNLLIFLSEFEMPPQFKELCDDKSPLGSIQNLLNTYTFINPNKYGIFSWMVDQKQHHHHLDFAKTLKETVKSCKNVSEIIAVYADIKVAFDEYPLSHVDFYNVILATLKFLEPQVIAQISPEISQPTPVSHNGNKF